ncbi:MAG: NAD-glutamate dehydrogenase, partial [Alphaproteobacteria bacterium]|nr:NAD-glutamate dehydrogenase [Alphaproteobacteria bacterium]
HEDLYRNSMGILHLQERQHLALFMRQDSFGRFVTCLIYVPRDNYDTSLREKFRHIIESELNGTQTTFTTRIDDQRLARVFAVIHLKNGMPKGFSQERLEKKLREAARAWPDRLRECLIEKQGITIGSALHQKYAHSFPSAYTAHFRPEHAVNDILQISKMPRGQNLIADLIADDDNKQAVHLRVYHRGKPLELSSVMPIIENMGLMAESETGPFAVIDKDEKIFVHSFKAKLQGDSTIDLTAIHDEFLKTFVSVWQGHQDNDTFNQLILLAGMTGRQVVLVRALSRYLKQIRAPHSLISITHTLVKHAQLSQLLLKLFELRHSPAITSQARKQFSKIRAEFMAGLAKVPTLDEDRILRRLLNLIEAAMRTNFYQDNAPALAIKFDCAAVENMPLPRMKYEIFVHSSLVEGIHLRGGKVARGGIRWSDREDFRTEILGLVKAQMVKNAVIVPVGSKGGFVVRQKLSADHYQDGITCYQIYIRSLLSLTDNLVKGKIIPPKQVLRHDGDDPYLVVAADKGTAKFSDIANTISQEHGFWLDDAFASGGSVGYDHKEMGITARGAWESVKRHFREMGHDTQSQNFTVMGVGDMSGDVFGNGMLLSKHIRLLGAFDHRHIFCDPNPDAAKSFKERERMFHLPKSSWANYHAKLISKGGGIFSRQEKSIRITPEMKAAYDIGAETLSPQDLINAMLKAPVDLLYLGGIGTYVKASTETHEQVDDRANDSLRVNAKELRAKVVAEGANLGCTQRARIEFAKLGGRINTDAIDNSAGVDTSDHEVNIKIAFAPSLISAKLKRPARNKLLRDMTDDVAKLVLRDNYLQTQALTVAQLRGNELVHLHARTIAALEKTGLLNRQVEFLPDEEELSARMRDGQTLTRPELAVLLAYAKIWLFDQLLASNLPDDPWLKGDLLRYFPKKMSDKFSRDIAQHQLAREIIATSITNSFINRAGSQFVFRAMEKTGQNAVAVTRAYVIARDSYQLVSYWRAIESLDNVAPAAVQAELFLYTERLLSYVVPWILRETKVTQPFEKQIDDLGSACQKMRTWLDENTPVSAKVNASQLIAQKVPEPLAKTAALIPLLSAAPDVHWLSQKYNVSIAQGSALFFSVGDRFNFSWLREKCRASAQNTQWQRDAISGLIEDLFITQRMLCGKILSSHRKQWHDPAAWFAGSTRLQAIDHTMNELRHSTAIDFAG